ncbi:MAG: hypothetical protein M3Q29_02235 [Chloroflexota bacterium]|nr:hypothetical protein [Chloroflexota bacterium]
MRSKPGCRRCCGRCGGAACEAAVKERTRATIRVVPFAAAGWGPCAGCGTEGERVYWARAGFVAAEWGL